MIKRNSFNSEEKRAKKKFGQNFLKDETVLHRIIESMPNDDRPVVEIGPGLGDLTRYLVEKKDVTAYEVDRDLCGHLRQRFAADLENGRLKLRCTDVLSHWEKESLEDRPYHLVANLPYYIATNIILRALKDPNCSSLLVMVQKEVAEKFSAKAGEKAFSSLAVLAQSCGDARLLFDVPPESFVPAPKVMSSILRIVKHCSLDDPAFETFLKTAFTQPRKTLARNLSARFDKNDVKRALERLGLKPSVRPHEVETSLYHHLYSLLKGDTDGRKETAGEQPLQQQSEQSKQSEKPE
ncbi:16S rRNA (adenine(1518)-N(6)/adenine(1519)-N(6))-dimethyltransferase RsmA [Hydrogenimonas sp.]|uniref:16S rRNA (adenine(1518)-N(6)/adenine(1519)-N(6))- dimethyltransferase RsmA n=1 Tax=Hydrogenimonas sp. TaxID=2231112 RepID=UPI002609AD5B|nr:16S rRNA (adenine(1518)-N(6)/adenine(1519)-N(6))-dimethyltransferase RsmA [Hydrogenimonas sp.]